MLARFGFKHLYKNMNENVDYSEGCADDEGTGGRESLANGASYAEAIFDRHGVAPTDRIKLVGQVLKLAYSAAHRRVRGAMAWTIPELETLARHYGDTLDEVFVAIAKRQAIPATFVVGLVRLKCQVWLGRATSRPSPGGLVAIKTDGRWTVVPVEDGLTGELFAVRQLMVETDPVQGSRIAVLDDQPSVTESLCVFLRQAGFDASPFHGIEGLEAAVASAPFDAYVLDWLIGDRTIGPLVEALRQQDALCPIAILTGRADEGEEVASDIADLVTKHDVHYFSKPVPPHMITALLTRLIAAQFRG